jgi:hypothetical protein
MKKTLAVHHKKTSGHNIEKQRGKLFTPSAARQTWKS